MQRILHHLLTAPTEIAPIDDLDAWWTRHVDAAAPYDVPVDRAMAGAAASDRLGYAFASGYREALRALLPEVGAAKLAFCATEAGGNRPRHIQSHLEPDGEGWRLTGDKKWTTMGQAADELLVFASTGTDDQGRNRLALVRIPSFREGVTVAPGADTPFVPEIPHAAVSFDRVRVEPAERLPGDAYERYLKPFRTVEDVHVHAALLAHVLQVARAHAWPEDAIPRFAALLAAARALALADPTAPSVHVALAGLIDETQRLLADLAPHWDHVPEPLRARWRRDQPLMGVASTARTKRLEVARAALAAAD